MIVNKTTKQSGMKGKKGKLKVLNLKKETVKSLSAKEARDVKGGVISTLRSTGRSN